MTDDRNEGKNEHKELSLVKEDLTAYQDGLDNLSFLKQKMTERRELFMLENEGLTKKIRALDFELSGRKSQFVALAVTEYGATGNKKLIGGLGIRVGTTLTYEPETAFAWAVKHSMCLSLDRRNFDKIAKTQDIGFVEKKESVTVTFPKDIKVED